jgi:hypothetical protein
MNNYKNFKNIKDDGLTADWLSDIGLKNKTFNTTRLIVARAQMMAHKLLSQHRELLTTGQLISLIEFEKSCNRKHDLERITDTSCYMVMNANTSVYRKLAEKKRKVKKKLRTSSN